MLSTPPAFVLSQDQTLMFNPYPQLHAYSRTTRQSRSLSSFRQGVSLFQNLTVVDASSHLPALFVNILLVQNDFLCIVFKDRSLSFASLATTSRIIAKGAHFVNPIFQTFPIPNLFPGFEPISVEFSELCHFFLKKHPAIDCIPSTIFSFRRHACSSILNITSY